MVEISQLPRELIEMILAKVDHADDISSCALVCCQWLDIVNNHRPMQTSIIYDRNNTAEPHQLIRRFKHIRFQEILAWELPATDVNDLCQRAQIVVIDQCKFPDLHAMKEHIVACGNLSRLEIFLPTVKNLKLPFTNAEAASKSFHQKIDTLVLEIDLISKWHILKIFQDMDVQNVELWVYEPCGPELQAYLCFVEELYHDKIRAFGLINASCFEFLRSLPRLELHEFCTLGFDSNEELLYEFLTCQPTISKLDLADNEFYAIECALRLLPPLKVLKLLCYENIDNILSVIRENTDVLCKLCYLDLKFITNCTSTKICDITFIAKLPHLQTLCCWQFSQVPSSIEILFGPIENPMLKMKEFSLVSERGFDIDAGSLANILKQMPNLEKITLELAEKSAGPCQFGPLNALKKLAIPAAIISDEASIQSMTLPNLRYLKLCQNNVSKWKKPPVFEYLPQIMKNCQLLSRIRYNDKVLVRRSINGEFRCNDDYPIAMFWDMLSPILNLFN